MILMLTIAMVMSIISVALVNATTTDLNGSRQLLGRSEARMLASSALNEFYARFAADQSFLTPLLDTSEGTVVDHVAFTPANQVKSPTEKWARFDGATVVPCAATGENQFDQDCFTVSATVERTVRSDAGTTTRSDIVRAVLLDVTSRVRCGGIEDRCLYSRVQQRIRPQQFYNSLLYYQFTTLDPNLYPDPSKGDTLTADGMDVTQAEADCAGRYALARPPEFPDARPSYCVNVSFTTGDIISGPVTTLDNYIVTCGAPEFANTVVRVFGGYIPPAPATPSARVYATSLELARAAGVADDKLPLSCGAPDPTSTSETPPPALFPGTSASLLVDPTFQLPPPTTSISRAQSLADLVFTQADPAQPVGVTFSTRVEGEDPVTTVTVTNTDKGGTFEVDLPTPANDVIVIRAAAGDSPAPVDVQGTLAGRVSLFAEKDLRIAGDIVYQDGQNSSNTRDILGLVAGEDVVLKTPTTTGNVGSGLTVAALATSLGGSIYTENWRTASVSTNGLPWAAGTLNWFGSLSSMYQGVFGGSNFSTGAYVSGYKKAFTFDARAASGTISPPYVASPEKTSWVRLASLEVPPDR